MDTGLSQYEQIKVGNMTRRTSGTAIAGLVVGVGAVVTAKKVSDAIKKWDSGFLIKKRIIEYFKQ